MAAYSNMDHMTRATLLLAALSVACGTGDPFTSESPTALGGSNASGQAGGPTGGASGTGGSSPSNGGGVGGSPISAGMGGTAGALPSGGQAGSGVGGTPSGGGSGSAGSPTGASGGGVGASGNGTGGTPPGGAGGTAGASVGQGGIGGPCNQANPMCGAYALCDVLNHCAGCVALPPEFLLTHTCPPSKPAAVDCAPSGVFMGNAPTWLQGKCDCGYHNPGESQTHCCCVW